jgi:TatD DNase family protein
MLKGSKVSAMMHCFSGTVEQATTASNMGCTISIPTNVVYVKSKQKIAKAVPIESLVFETDAPYLSPKKGERNEPANIGYAVEKVANLKGISPEKVAEKSFQNTLEFYGIRW